MLGGTVSCICRQGSNAADETTSLCSRLDNVDVMSIVDNRTPLHWAAAAGQTAAVASLLELNAQPAPLDADGATPLDYARMGQHGDCVQLLQRRLTTASSKSQCQLENYDVTAEENDSNSSYTSFKTPFRFLTNLFSFKRLSSKDGSDQQTSSSRSDMETAIMQDAQATHTRTTAMKPRSPNPQRFYKTLETMKSLEKLYMSRTDDPELHGSDGITSSDEHDSNGGVSQLSQQSTEMGDGNCVAAVQQTDPKSPISVRSTESQQPAVILPDINHLIRSPPPVHKGTLTYLAGGSPGTPFLCGSPRKDHDDVRRPSFARRYDEDVNDKSSRVYQDRCESPTNKNIKGLRQQGRDVTLSPKATPKKSLD